MCENLNELTCIVIATRKSLYSLLLHVMYLLQGCHQVGKALSMPAVAVLSGLIVTVGFCMSHSRVEVEATD